MALLQALRLSLSALSLSLSRLSLPAFKLFSLSVFGIYQLRFLAYTGKDAGGESIATKTRGDDMTSATPALLGTSSDDKLTTDVNTSLGRRGSTGVSGDGANLGVRLCQLALVAGSTIIIVLTFPISVWFCVRVVQQYERAVIYRFGRVRGARGPGLYFVHALIDTVHVMDLRTVTFNIPPQEILTRDSVTISVDAVVYYRIFDPVKSNVVVCDVHRATRLMAQTTLRNTLGTKSLHEILGEKAAIALAMQDNLDCATDPWGVKVERVEVRDARLPVLMQRAMAVEAEAQREANASVIAAEGELTAALTLREAAMVISQTPLGARLRFLQTLSTIAVEKHSTVLFPMPLQLMLDNRASKDVEAIEID